MITSLVFSHNVQEMPCLVIGIVSAIPEESQETGGKPVVYKGKPTVARKNFEINILNIFIGKYYAPRT